MSTLVPDRLPDVPITLIDEDRKDRYLREGYCPVSFDGPAEEKRFIDEWFSVLESLDVRLRDYWKPGIGDGDYFIDHECVPDRFLGLEIRTQRMLQPRLLRIVHDTLLRFEPDYCVDVCNSWVFFEHPDYPEGNAGPYFYIFVEKNRILAYSKADDILRQLGIDASAS